MLLINLTDLPLEALGFSNVVIAVEQHSGLDNPYGLCY